MPMDPARVQTRRALPDPATAARAAWLERFYDLVFVACVGRFANELGATPDLTHILSVLGWLTGLWGAWFLVSMRLNRFPDEGWLTRGIVVAQLLATTVAVAAAISATRADDLGGMVATAALSLGISARYPHDPPPRRRRPAPRRRARSRQRRGGRRRPAVARPAADGGGHPGERHRAGVPDRRVRLVPAPAARATGRSSHGTPGPARPAVPRPDGPVVPEGGVRCRSEVRSRVPRGHRRLRGRASRCGRSTSTAFCRSASPCRAGPQRSWLIAQLGLALGVTVAAAAVTALPPSRTGTVNRHWRRARGRRARPRSCAAFAVLARHCAAPGPAPGLRPLRCRGGDSRRHRRRDRRAASCPTARSRPPWRHSSSLPPPWTACSAAGCGRRSRVIRSGHPERWRPAALSRAARMPASPAVRHHRVRLGCPVPVAAGRRPGGNRSAQRTPGEAPGGVGNHCGHRGPRCPGRRLTGSGVRAAARLGVAGGGSRWASQWRLHPERSRPAPDAQLGPGTRKRPPPVPSPPPGRWMRMRPFSEFDAALPADLVRQAGADRLRSLASWAYLLLRPAWSSSGSGRTSSSAGRRPPPQGRRWLRGPRPGGRPRRRPAAGLVDDPAGPHQPSHPDRAAEQRRPLRRRACRAGPARPAGHPRPGQPRRPLLLGGRHGRHLNNVAHIGPRWTGNGATDHLLVPPGWHGQAPADMPVIRSPTVSACLYNRMLAGYADGDIGRVRQWQAGLAITQLSHYGEAQPALDERGHRAVRASRPQHAHRRPGVPADRPGPPRP